MEKIVRLETLERRLKIARHNRKYIKLLYYKFILFVLNLFEDINRVINGFNYKGEWEKQNKQLDTQKKRIDDLEKEKKELEERMYALANLAHERYLEIEELTKKLKSKNTIIRNLNKRFKEVKGK